MSMSTLGWLAAAFVAFVLVLRWLNVLKEYERGVIFRLGRVLGRPRGPGLTLVFWPIDRMVRIDLRTVTQDIPPQDVITRDNVSINVNAVLYFRVIDPVAAVVKVEHYLYATSQLAQTTLRSVLGTVELDELLAEREKLNHLLQTIIDRQTDPWGVKVSMVEIKHVDLPTEMRRAMARQAEAEREKRAKIIHADGEYLSAQRLADAAHVMQKEPATLQLRYLHTLTEVASDRMSTLVFPVPVDLLARLLDQTRRPEAEQPRTASVPPVSRPASAKGAEHNGHDPSSP